MKILVLQLARLGDIYMSWPLIRALKRKHPEAEIDMLVRPRFSAATDGLIELRRHIELPMPSIFAPLFKENPDTLASFQALDGFIEDLSAENYDWIINVSFSPVSSYITHLLTKENTMVHGYSRHEDGFLHITDDSSAFFYAQVGPGRPNRIHLSDFFTMMVDIDCLKEDWRPPEMKLYERELPEKYVVLHVGASEAKKSYSAIGWKSAVEDYLAHPSAIPVVLIGSADEQETANIIATGIETDRLINLVGQTKIQDLFTIINSAELLIGCDSAPIHVASLTGTATLNISFNSVNFWETGPRAYRSRVIRGATEEEIPGNLIAAEMISMLNREKPKEHTIESYAGVPGFKGYVDTCEDFEWALIKSLYMGDDFPMPVNELFTQGCRKIAEINEILLAQLAEIKRHGDVDRISGIFSRCEEVIIAISHIVPNLKPIVAWYQTEKTRIGPWSRAEIVNQTERIHLVLKQITDVYEVYAQQIQKAEVEKVGDL